MQYQARRVCPDARQNSSPLQAGKRDCSLLQDGEDGYLVWLITRRSWVRVPLLLPFSALIAQLVEHLTFNQVVLGSSPSGGTNFQNDTTGYL